MGTFRLGLTKWILRTGAKNLGKSLCRPMSSGVTDISAILITPDGNNYVYEYGRRLSDLYLVSDPT